MAIVPAIAISATVPNILRINIIFLFLYRGPFCSDVLFCLDKALNNRFDSFGIMENAYRGAREYE